MLIIHLMTEDANKRKVKIGFGQLPLELTIRPVSTIKRLTQGEKPEYINPIIYLVFCLACYLAVRYLISYDPLMNAVAISGEELSTTPGIRTFKKAGYFTMRHFFTFLFFFALVTGVSCRIFFANKRIGQRLWWKICLYLSGQLLLFTTICMPLTFIWPHIYFVPFILEALYLIPVITLVVPGNIIARILQATFAVVFGHGFYFLLFWGSTTAIISAMG